VVVRHRLFNRYVLDSNSALFRPTFQCKPPPFLAQSIASCFSRDILCWFSIHPPPKQLNFYSFRKINRERSVWIYQHNLFHRDHPEDLHQVRRRTCPGVDGRKQRFSRLSAQRLSGGPQENKDDAASDPNSDMDDVSLSSVEDSSEGEEIGFEAKAVVNPPKRKVVAAITMTAKRARISPVTDEKAEKPRAKSVEIVKPFVLTNPEPSPRSVTALFQVEVEQEDKAAEDDGSTEKKKIDRMEMIQQSLIVSEVSVKLEEFVRKALKGRGLLRTRKGASGIVTPPYGANSKFTMTSRDLITYDDEYECDESRSLGVVSDSDESVSGEGRGRGVDIDMLVAPVSDRETAKHIGDEILRRASVNPALIEDCANVAAFFMGTAPNEGVDQISKKVIQLLANSTRLEADFYFYSTALHPTLFLDSNSSNTFTAFHSRALRNSLCNGQGRIESLRRFKVFAVNLIYRLLGRNGGLGIQEPLASEDHAILLRAAEIWSKSAGIGA
jgi:HSF-type DNA-binding